MAFENISYCFFGIGIPKYFNTFFQGFKAMTMNSMIIWIEVSCGSCFQKLLVFLMIEKRINPFMDVLRFDTESFFGNFHVGGNSHVKRFL